MQLASNRSCTCSAMVVSDVGCAGGSDALSALAARLAERAVGAPSRAPPPPQSEEDNLTALIHGLRIGARPPTVPPPPAHTPLHEALVHPPPPTPLQPPAAPPPYLAVPEPDSNAATARFEAAFAAATPRTSFLPPPPAPHQTPALAHLPWQRSPFFPGAMPPHPMMHHPGMPLFTPPAPPMQAPPPPPPYGAPGPSTRPPAAQAETQTQANAASEDRLYEEIVAMLQGGGERTPHDAEALGLLSEANQSWGEDFTSLDTAQPERHPGDEYDDEDEDDDDDDDEPIEMSYTDDLAAAGVVDPAEQPFRFERQNAFGGAPAAETLAEGIRLRNLGQLARAALAFEATVNRPADDPHPPLDHVDQLRAWHLLGITLAESDDDPRAIQALAQVQANGGGGEARELETAAALALAVSYVNELNIALATQQLQRWLSLRGGAAVAVGEGPDEALANVARALEAEARATPRDAEVLLALGVAHNAARDYERAAVSMRRAVAARDTDARLWNRLGATLANGGRADDALRAYRRAVDLFPLYTRAWVNVGTAYANNGDAARAARYYVRALAIADDHEAAPEDMRHVWAYLRTALVTLGRDDLLALCEAQDLVSLRRNAAW